MNNLRLYKIDIEYIKYLYSFDNRIQYNPNREDEYTAKRPYLGVVLKIDEFDYFVPLEHPRQAHQKMKNNIFIFKIHNGKYGILGFNNMIPVKRGQLIDFDINKENTNYKQVLISQYHFCNKHCKEIQEKAKETYTKSLNNSFMKKICCNFKLLEEKCLEYKKCTNAIMKRKYADYPNWERVLKKEYKNRYFNNADFKGNISLLTAVKVKEKLVVGDDNLVIIDDGFKWLEIYPENNKNIAISVCINNKNEFLEWYFDIAKDSALTEEGVPYIDDLYLDVILAPSGEIKMIDQEELQEALDKKIIMQEDFDLAYKVANNLINQLQGKVDKVIEFTKKYFDILNNNTNEIIKFSINYLKEVKTFSINKLSQYEINNLKFIKVMFGNTSKAGEGFEYKVNEINHTDNWHPETNDAKDLGGFNFSIEEKILRWLVRGDTLYDVIIPDDTEVYDCGSPSAPHGVFRSNKIIISNPRTVTDEMAMHFYKKSILPEKSYYKAMAGCAIRGYMNTAIQIFQDKINKENVNIAFEEFKDFIKPDEQEYFNAEYLGANTKIIYDMFVKLKKID